MTTTMNTRPMTAQDVAKVMGIAPQTRATSKRHYGDAFRFINREIEVWAGSEMPFEFWPMVLGIQWSRATGRLNAAAEMALRSLTPYQYIALLVELAGQFSVMGEVPYYLNRKWN